MEGSGEEKEEVKQANKIATFSVPLDLGEIKENLTVNSHTPSSPSKEEIINQAIEFHSQGNIREAAKYYQYLINKDFADHRVFTNYGIILKGLGKYKEAELSQRKAIELNPDYATAHYNHGNILRDLGKTNEAEVSTRKAIELAPNFANAHYNLGNILKVIGRLKEAELSLRKAIELNPDFAEAYSNLGNTLSGLGRLKEAELSLLKAIELNPDFAEAYSNLANTLTDLGRLKEAELLLRKAIEIKPGLPDLYLNLGNTLELLGKREEAISLWEKAVELNPEADKSVIALANHLCYKQKYDLALQYLSKNKSNSCQILYLECLLSLDREKDFNEKYMELSKKRVCNAKIGGIVEHANIIYEKKYNSSFCNESIKYVLIDKINEELFSENDRNEMIDYTRNSEKEDRPQGLLNNGIQTVGNLFLLDYPFIKSIKKALEMKIEQYKQKFKHSEQGFITHWPKNYELRSWMISMKSGGFLKQHNHEYSWITGSYYIQIPKYNNNDDSGKIAFSYQGPRFPNKEKNFNLTIKNIEDRDICIFPSSLFHHTIPFQSEKERICFVFDLIKK